MPIVKTIFERFRNSYKTVLSLILYEGYKIQWKQWLLVRYGSQYELLYACNITVTEQITVPWSQHFEFHFPSSTEKWLDPLTNHHWFTSEETFVIWAVWTLSLGLCFGIFLCCLTHPSNSWARVVLSISSRLTNADYWYLVPLGNICK